MDVRRLVFAAALILTASVVLPAAEMMAVPVDEGSVAHRPPPHPELDALLDREPMIEPSLEDRALPTNDWWTTALLGPFPGTLYPMPLSVRAAADGVRLWHPRGWNEDGTSLLPGAPLLVQPVADGTRTLAHATVADVGDWHVQLRLHAAENKHPPIDLTLCRGMPTVWFEGHGSALRITLEDSEIADLHGRKLEGAPSKPEVLLRSGDRAFACFTGPESEWQRDGEALVLQLPKGGGHLAVCPIPDEQYLALFRRHAHVVPRDTLFAFSYEPEDGTVTTNWTTRTEALHGNEERALQGWLPHHWRTATPSFAFEDAEFHTQRGRLRLSAGNKQRITRRFVGLVPAVPLPEAAAAQPGLERLGSTIAAWSDAQVERDQSYRHDTYWGAKDALALTRMLTIARQLELPQTAALAELSRSCLADWFTYTPGEEHRFFARLPRPWSGLVGFDTAYGSGRFNDHHFHYGYFTLSAVLLGMYDQDWLRSYGKVATLLAKQYANWERTDKRFPYLRTFDPWAGHSYADGFGDAEDGNNQESTSEALQSWAGLFLLGGMLGDERMQACGAMGYAIESEAAAEYWHDWAGKSEGAGPGNFPPQYEPTIVGVLRDRDQGFWTWFSGEPIHVYGIHFQPSWTTLHGLARRPDLVRYQVGALRRVAGSTEAGASFDAFDPKWADEVLGYLAWSDPDSVLTVMAEADDAEAVAGPGRDHHGAVARYLALAFQELGRVDWTAWSDLPTSLVFIDDTGRRMLVAWNPEPRDQQVAVHLPDYPKVRIDVPPGGPHRLPLP